MVVLEELTAGYGDVPVLNSVNCEVATGGIVSLIGPNASGKSTLLRSIMGMSRLFGGRVLFDGLTLNGLGTESIVKSGIGFCPQGHKVFGSLSVQNNLRIGGHLLNSQSQVRDRVGAIVDQFPILGSRSHQLAGQLSGGEKQLLAIGMTLMRSPKVLLLDEPSLGLADNTFMRIMSAVIDACRNGGISVILVEQKVDAALRMSDYTYGLRLGRIVWSGRSVDLTKDIQDSIIFGFH